MKKNQKQGKGNIKYGIYIAGPAPKTAKILERAVMKILGSGAGDEVKKEALRIMANGLSTSANVSVCNISS